MNQFKAFQFKITLLDTKPAVWRRIVIPTVFSFHEFHSAIQAAFGWENSHLFEFSKNGLIDPEGGGIGYEDEETGSIDANGIPLDSIFRKVGDQFKYIYDFGDYWDHQVVLEKIMVKEMYVPHCLTGKNECPPEDVGGVHGYREMVRVFAEGPASEKASYRRWLGLRAGEDWDPTYYSQRETNKRMSLLTLFNR